MASMCLAVIKAADFYTAASGYNSSNTSSGVLSPKHFLGRLFSSDLISFMAASETVDVSVFFGINLLIRLLTCLTAPFSHE